MKLLYFIVLTGLCMACHQPRVYRINGSLPGALDGYVVKLYNIDTYPDVLLEMKKSSWKEPGLSRIRNIAV